MDVFPKFIIETDGQGEDYLVVAKCTYHKQLAFDPTKVKGGGWWALDKDIFTLFGESHDFGKAKIENIKDCVRNKRVFSSYHMYRNLSEKFKFQYKTEIGEIIDLEDVNQPD